MTAQDSLRESTLTKLVAKLINGTQAAEILQLAVRQVRRLKGRFVKQGVKGILHKNRGRASNHAVPERERKAIAKIIKTSYPDFGPTLAAEKLSELHDLTFSNETIRTIMIEQNLWQVKSMASEKFPHVWRQRKDCLGQMEQYDGSYHNWFEGRLKTALGEAIMESCLLCAIDDATGAITKAQFADNEGVMATLTFWQEYIQTQGKPVSIYLDRGTTYKTSPKKNLVHPLELTQFERACRQVGIELIHARSPQAKGRIERLFETLQDRLIKDMRLNNISTIAEANIFLVNIFIPRFNQKFAVTAKKRTNLHTVMTPKQLSQLPAVMSVHDQRTVMNDYTVMHQGKLYQVDPKQPALVRIGDRLTVQTRTNGQIFLVKDNSQLKFTEIMERPKKALVIQSEDGRRFGNKPAASHPWGFKRHESLSLKKAVLTR